MSRSILIRLLCSLDFGFSVCGIIILVNDMWWLDPTGRFRGKPVAPNKLYQQHRMQHLARCSLDQTLHKNTLQKAQVYAYSPGDLIML